MLLVGVGDIRRRIEAIALRFEEPGPAGASWNWPGNPGIHAAVFILDFQSWLSGQGMAAINSEGSGERRGAVGRWQALHVGRAKPPPR